MENTQRECPFLVRANRFLKNVVPGTELTVEILRRFGYMGIREGDTPRAVRCESCTNSMVMYADVTPDPESWPVIGTISHLALQSTICLHPHPTESWN